jgi:uncharacterized protein YyaL (SSP411 family)
VEQQAAAFRDHFAAQGSAALRLPEGFAPDQTAVSPDVLREAANKLVAQMDRVHGGFGRAPKFPHPMALEFLLRVASRAQSTKPGESLSGVAPTLLPHVRLTLDKMAAGGIYDQVGGGFHRYSTDAIWLVPHFEKMLYDNAQLAPVYLHAWQLTGEERYRRVCEETLDYALREMSSPEGGFYSTQDADSEGVEGKFYVWTPEELRAVLGDVDAAIVEAYWGASERGDFEGKNILHVARSVEDTAQLLDMSPDLVREAVARARERLYKVRGERVWPGCDDKVLTAWNGWMQRAFAEAGRILDRADYREAAARNADFLRTNLTRDGRLLRTWRNGQAKIDAYLEDYTSLVNALLSTYEATSETRYFIEARGLADEFLARFWDDATGSFFDTAQDAEALIGRPRELTDNVTPSGTSGACEALLRLAAYTGEERFREHAVRVLVALAPSMADAPSAFGNLLCALDDHLGPFHEVALIGAPDSPEFTSLQHALASRYLPRMVLAQGAPDQEEHIVPLLAGRGLVDAQPAAYVCQGFVCQRPVTTPDQLLGQIDG